MARSPAFRRSALRVARGALIIAAVTAVCYRTKIHDASTALLLLIALWGLSAPLYWKRMICRLGCEQLRNTAHETSEAGSPFWGNNLMNLVTSSEVWPMTSNPFCVAGKMALITSGSLGIGF